jgi:hypothetical protein
MNPCHPERSRMIRLRMILRSREPAVRSLTLANMRLSGVCAFDRNLGYSDCMVRLLVVTIFASLSVLAQTNNMQNATVQLQRRGCLGTCPAYNLAIFANGKVSYEGLGFVHAKGHREGKMRPAKVEALVRDLTDKGLFDLADNYGQCIDAPSTAISLTVNGRIKQTKTGCGGPEKLRELSREIDKVSGSDKWTRGRVRILLHWPWIRL